MPTKPLLSIGMIFKDEIRCLERCMKSLAPLREAVPCELIMADTGSDDGSREVAEKYADMLFDFPWVDDFSAARNAVLDRCSGEWHMQIDADEWLDEDCSELVWFLKNYMRVQKDYSVFFNSATLTIRNYIDPSFYNYTDSRFGRIQRMSTGARYEGAIHEAPPMARFPGQAYSLHRTLLHHDGYVGLHSTEFGAKKRERNLTLLRAELSKKADNLNLLEQYIESGQNAEDYIDTVRRALALVEEKHTGWELLGPAIFRSATLAAAIKKLPELDVWIAQAEEWFPDSVYTRMDVAYTAFMRSWEKGDYTDAIRRGEAWLQYAAEFRAGSVGKDELRISTVNSAQFSSTVEVQTLLAHSHLEAGTPDRAWELLNEIDDPLRNGKRTRQLLWVLRQLHAVTDLDTKPLLLKFWKEINSTKHGSQLLRERQEMFGTEALCAFDIGARDDEKARLDYRRPGYTLFLPLAGEHRAGDLALLMEEQDVGELERLLCKEENLEELPALVLCRVLLSGVAFPLPGKPLQLEQMDILADRISTVSPQITANLIITASEGDYAAEWQTLAWTRGLALAAVQSCDWTDVEQGLALAGAFAKVERAFLSRYYADELLCDENILVLPPMHRFGWYCAKAYEALDGGDAVGYVQMLKQALSVHPGMKPMVEFLTDHTPQLQVQKPSGELLALAEQVRTILFAYAPDDPAVEALKQSAAYQKVAHLIEGPEVFGGLVQ